jgi:hypothetical protein
MGSVLIFFPKEKGDGEELEQAGEWTAKSMSLKRWCCGIFKQGNGTPRLFRKQCLLACGQWLSGFTCKG